MANPTITVVYPVCKTFLTNYTLTGRVSLKDISGCPRSPHMYYLGHLSVALVISRASRTLNLHIPIGFPRIYAFLAFLMTALCRRRIFV
jgi:hypothetical protein